MPDVACHQCHNLSCAQTEVQISPCLSVLIIWPTHSLQNLRERTGRIKLIFWKAVNCILKDSKWTPCFSSWITSVNFTPKKVAGWIRGGQKILLLYALTSNPGLVRIFRRKGKEVCSRLMGVQTSGLLATWTKSSPSVKSHKRRQFPLGLPPSVLSDMRVVEE